MSLPTGAITFLLTDLKGSTRLWEEHPEAMARAVARHEALAGEIIASRGGVLVKNRGEGDSLFTVFPRAGDAVAAACDLQFALAREPWPEETPLLMRIALHTGEAQQRDGDYYGPVVNRCARLRALAHGGQALLSLATFEAAQSALPGEADVQDLGLHALRDLREPERVYQIAHRQVRSEFPPLPSLGSFPNNLPVELTSFVGREEETEEVRRLLRNTHLLTLTGAGGCGKTRLALHLAADLVGECEDGVWLVELGALSDPNLVPYAVASALRVKEEAGRTLLETLCDHLRTRNALLLLDNCEHVVAAAAKFANSVLRCCDRLRILATSREPLRVAGEVTYGVPSLSLPGIAVDPVSLVERSVAARLFVERAASANPSFAVTPQNAPTVAQICRRLDGIPLALELAAARVKALPVEQIARRLDDRFRLLTGGSRTALPHQQTLRALIDWSYDLLSLEEQTLLCRLAVFAGGWTLEAAEAICGEDGFGGDVLDLLCHLVEKSLVLAEQGPTDAEAGPRYSLLETIRKYGCDRLSERGEMELMRVHHRNHFLALAEQAEPQMLGPDEALWLERLEAEHDNFRAALASPEDAEKHLRLAFALWWFWYVRGYLSEGRRWLEDALARCPDAPESLRAGALNGAGVLAWGQGDLGAARRYHEESLAIWQRLDNPRMIAGSYNNLAFVAIDENRYAEAYAFYERSLGIYQALGDEARAARVLTNLGDVANTQSDVGASRARLEEALAAFQRLGDKGGIAAARNNMGEVELKQGELARADSHFKAALLLFENLGDRAGISSALRNIGLLSCARGEYERAAELLGAAEALRETVGASLPPFDVPLYEERKRDLQGCLGPDAFAASWARGREIPTEKAVAGALAGN